MIKVGITRGQVQDTVLMGGDTKMTPSPLTNSMGMFRFVD